MYEHSADRRTDSNAFTCVATRLNSARGLLSYRVLLFFVMKPSRTLINTSKGVYRMIPQLLNHPTIPPSLYIDLEGVKLCRYGTVSILQIHVLPVRHTYLVDIHVLGAAAFNSMQQPVSGFNERPSLKSILENKDIPKVFFDVRRDADALHWHFGISVDGIWDVQLMEVASRRGNRKRLSSLQQCVVVESSDKQFSVTKHRGQEMFDPNKGGSYQVFNQRPLSEEIIRYCAEDVQQLPLLWSIYYDKISQRWMEKLRIATAERLRQAKGPFVDYGPHMALSPW
jgi:exonuclease 3'-5' domain-containing protein 1